MNQDILDIKKMRYELDPILYHFGLTRNKQGAILESLLAAQIAKILYCLLCWNNNAKSWKQKAICGTKKS